MQEIFIGREKELADLNGMYAQRSFQMFVLYGRRRVGKTTLLNEFCKINNRFGDIIFKASDIKYEQFEEGDYDE